jgi:hypothetical protein
VPSSRAVIGLWAASVTIAVTSSLAYLTLRATNGQDYGLSIEESHDWFRYLLAIFGISAIAGATLSFRRRTKAAGIGVLVGAALVVTGTAVALVVYVISDGS